MGMSFGISIGTIFDPQGPPYPPKLGVGLGGGAKLDIGIAAKRRQINVVSPRLRSRG